MEVMRQNCAPFHVRYDSKLVMYYDEVTVLPCLFPVLSKPSFVRIKPTKISFHKEPPYVCNH